MVKPLCLRDNQTRRLMGHCNTQFPAVKGHVYGVCQDAGADAGRAKPDGAVGRESSAVTRRLSAVSGQPLAGLRYARSQRTTTSGAV